MKLKECKDTIEIIDELEGGELIIEDKKDLDELKKICVMFASSQGFYGRLLRDILENEKNIKFPIIF